MKAKTALGVTALVLGMAVSAGAALVTNDGSPFYNTFAEGKAAAAKAGEPVLVKFYTDW